MPSTWRLASRWPVSQWFMSLWRLVRDAVYAFIEDDALSRGRVWLPMHLSLGGLLESAAEQHLVQDNFQLTNRWYSPSTRLTRPAGTSSTGWIRSSRGSRGRRFTASWPST